MDKKYKELLLKDLCARQLHGVIIDSAEYNKAAYRKHYLQRLISIRTLANKLVCIDVDDYPDPKIHDWKIELCKPYLRPMSSMTEAEKEEYEMLQTYPGFKTNHTDLTDMYDWLNEKMFDYRGLIEKGLALEAPEGMYN